MAFQPETSTFEAGVHQLELTDPVQGGAGGASNLPLLQLASRTKWLKDALDAASTALGFKAPLNSPNLTGTPTAPTAAPGDDTITIATTAFVQKARGGLATVGVGGNSNVSLSSAHWGCRTIVLAGGLTGNINVIFPTREGEWNVVNATTGAFSITCKTAAGTGVVVAQGKARTLYGDATNLYTSQTDLTDAALLGNPTAPTPSVADNDTTVATTAFVQAAVAAAIAASLAVPAGTIVPMAGSVTPSGYLKADGAVVSRTTYAALFSAIGTTYNTGGEAGTDFRLPDLRGEFVRGWDDARGVDAGRVFGTAQADELKAHVHLVTPPDSDSEGGQGQTVTGSTGSGETLTPYNTGSTGGTETRPRNVALLYVIKT